jgi:hypothetical protein
VAKENMVTRARDELFSHINRCGVLQAEPDDQRHWMDETTDYLAERYPDLTDGDLSDLYSVGIRFCQPAIPHGRKRFGFEAKEVTPVGDAPVGDAPVGDAPVGDAEADASVVDASVVDAPVVDAPVVEPQGSEEELVPSEVGGENLAQEG